MVRSSESSFLQVPGGPKYHCFCTTINVHPIRYFLRVLTLLSLRTHTEPEIGGIWEASSDSGSFVTWWPCSKLA